MHRLSLRLRHRFLCLLFFVLAISFPLESHAQDRRPRVYKSSVTPNWFADNAHFWYRNEGKEGRFEYVLVDAVNGIRKPAFDHDRLAKLLLESGLKADAVEKLSLDRLRFDIAEKKFAFRVAGGFWRCSLDTDKLTKLTEKEFAGESAGSGNAAGYVPRQSQQNGPETYITFINSTKEPVEVHWVDLSGKRVSYGRIESGKEREQHTFALHVWEVTNEKGELLTAFVGAEAHT